MEAGRRIPGVPIDLARKSCFNHAAESRAAGEAMVAAQALSLLCWDAIATLALNPEPPALLTYHERALRPQAVGLFVEALLASHPPLSHSMLIIQLAPLATLGVITCHN